jgi:replication factor C subunit 1
MSIAFSGIPDSHKDALRSYYEAKGQRVVVWSPNISSLLCSASALSSESWKTKEAQRLGIPCVLYTTVPYCGAAAPLWVDAYKPTTLSEVIGHTEQIRQLLAWLTTFLTAFPTSPHRIALITGPPGIGKTTVAHLVAAAAGYEVIERNASDERSGSAVRTLLETSSQSRHVGRKRLLIMDEVDGSDRGGIAEIARLGKTASFPLLCIANERSAPKLRPLVAVAMDVRFARPSKFAIAKALQWKLRSHANKTIGELELLVEQSGNDIRACWNALQFRASSRTTDTGKDALLRTDIFSATGRLFHANGTLNDRSSLVFVDSGIVPLMVQEGYIGAASRETEGAMDRCAEAAEWISVGDLVEKRIRSHQSWELMTHSALATVAAATAANGPAPFQIWPQWLGKQSKRTKHRTWIRAMESRSGLSFLDSQDLLRTQLFRPGQTAAAIVGDLESLHLTRDDMLDTLTDVTFTAVALDAKVKAAVTREWNKRCGKAEKTEKAEQKAAEEEDIVSEEEELDAF